MFEGLLLLVCILVVGKSINIQAHVPGDTALSSRLGKASLGVDDRLATLGGLDELWVLLLEDSEVFLGFPIPDAVRGKEKIHLLKSALVGLGVQAIDHGQRDDVGNTENIVGLLLEGLEDDGKDECEPAVTNRPANDTPGITLSTDLQWEDLSWVEPGDSEPSGAKCGCEEEDHSNSTGGVASSESRASRVLKTSSRQTASEEHRDTLND